VELLKFIIFLNKRLFDRKAFFVFSFIACQFLSADGQEIYMSSEVITLQNNKYVKVESVMLFDINASNLVTHFTHPNEYYTTNNEIGELKLYDPVSNKLITKYDRSLSTSSSLVYLFLNGKSNDLGFKRIGFTLVNTRFEDDMMISEWIPSNELLHIYSKVELVSRNTQPIYCGYYNYEGVITQKVYYSNYIKLKNVNFPQLLTSINYSSESDSTVIRTKYFDIKEGSNLAPELKQYKIPVGAILID
tara:strand:- start:1351 stop:2091 length:741 start_codon:yes stop_codon:yes gene_type:complete